MKRFETAAEGWRIMTRYPESRESARRLLLWLADTMDAAVAGIAYTGLVTAYQWTETVRRFTDRQPVLSSVWTHPFPAGVSYWFFGDVHGRCCTEILDLLAAQWSHLYGEKKRKIRRKTLIADSVHNPVSSPVWVAVSKSARTVLNALYIVCSRSAPLMLAGESGSGKHSLALLIHNSGPNPDAPFQTDTPAGKDGTIYISDWPFADPAECSVLLNSPARMIAGTSRLPAEAAQQWKQQTGGHGLFLRVPPLRERQEDIPLLASYFLEQTALKNGIPVPVITSAALELMTHYSWPGNLRELKAAVSWGLDCIRNNEIGAGQLPPSVCGAAAGQIPLSHRLQEMERTAIEYALEHNSGNMARTARELGLTPRQVALRIRKFGISINTD